MSANYYKEILSQDGLAQKPCVAVTATAASVKGTAEMICQGGELTGENATVNYFVVGSFSLCFPEIKIFARPIPGGLVSLFNGVPFAAVTSRAP